LYGNEVAVEELKDAEAITKLKRILVLYGFPLTIEGIQKELKNPVAPLKWSYNENSRDDKLQMDRIRKVYNNLRGTLKLLLWDSGRVTVMNRQGKIAGMYLFSCSYDNKSEELFENISEGMYLGLSDDWSRASKIGTMTDAKTPEEAEEWIKLFKQCQKMRDDNAQWREMSTLPKIITTGLVTITRLKDEVTAITNCIKEINRLEAEEKVKKDTAILDKIIIDKDSITIKALDDFTYKLTSPNMKWEKEPWVTFVYKHRYELDSYTYQKSATFFYDIFDQLTKLHFEGKLSVNGLKEVQVGFKIIVNRNQQEMLLTYLEGQRVANEPMRTALYDYFIMGQPLPSLNEEVDIDEKVKRVGFRKARDDTIVQEGIHGYVNDLEGQCPIDIGFEKDGQKWNLVIGEKRIHLRGGIEMIKSLERVLRGTAQGYNARHSTEELYTRLAEVIGEEEALQVITISKEMGKLVKALEGNKKE